jgi:hypothetical protein
MTRVTRRQHSFDQELAEQNKIRTYRSEYTDTLTGLVLVYREVITADTPDLFDRTPWWNRSQPKGRRKK